MRISHVELVTVRVPRRMAFGTDYQTALGRFTDSEAVIAFVATDAGIEGVGEMASCFSRRGEILRREAEQFLVPSLLGEDPFQIGLLVDRMDAALEGAEPAKAGFEMALFDIVGKALGVPVHQFLGGARRDAIPLSYSIPWGSIEDTSKLALDAVAKGFRTVKVKIGRDPTIDAERVNGIRAAIGSDVKLRVDGNMGYRSAKEALRFLDDTRDANLELLEQPLPRDDLEGHAFLRERSLVPIMLDESVWTPEDAWRALGSEAGDIVNVYVAEAGGILKAQQIFSICDAGNVACMIGSMPELGIATAAQIHLGVAVKSLPIACDTCGSLYHVDDLLVDPLHLEGGVSRPPTSPGLGVTVDMHKMQKYRIG